MVGFEKIAREVLNKENLCPVKKEAESAKASPAADAQSGIRPKGGIDGEQKETENG